MGLENQEGIHKVFLRIVSKEQAGAYKQVNIPQHYTSTIRDESRLAYAVLARSLKEDLGLMYDAATIYVTKDGKPFHEDNEYYFSFTHSDIYIACAIADEEVGVDIEQARTIKPQLLRKILTPEEINDSVNPIRAWVIKEAYGKFIGLGIGLGFTTLSAESLQNKYPNIILDEKSFICSLFYTNPDTDVQVQYTPEGDD